MYKPSYGSEMEEISRENSHHHVLRRRSSLLIIFRTHTSLQSAAEPVGSLCLAVELEPKRETLLVVEGQRAGERTEKVGAVEAAVAQADEGTAEIAAEVTDEVVGAECDEEEAVQSLDTKSDEQDEGERVGEKGDEVEEK